MKRMIVLAATILTAGCAQTATSPPRAAAIAAPQSSPSVREGQERLQQLGFYSGPIDGLNGPDTGAATASFQRSRGMAVTGQLDPTTIGALRAAASGPAPAGPPPAPANDAAELQDIQGRLRQLGFYRGPVDGVWGPSTQAALERFQSLRGLDVTGQPTRATVAALGLGPDARSARAANFAEPLDPPVIRTVQRRLRQLGFYSGHADGVWGARSSAAVERFQRSRGLQPTGDLNSTTLAALGLDPNDLRGSGYGSSVPR
jgi:peptidoglycan hydrolase-like protein with peptidoglycan-binding domain